MSKRIGNYRTERIQGGVAVYWRDQPARGAANAIRIFATQAEAETWINAR